MIVASHHAAKIGGRASPAGAPGRFPGQTSYRRREPVEDSGESERTAAVRRGGHAPRAGTGRGKQPRAGPRRRHPDGPPLRRARLRRPQLVPGRRPHHLGLRRPARPRPARTRRRPLPRLPLLRRRLLRLRPRPRTRPHRRRAPLQTAGAPHPAPVLRRRLRDREGVRDPGPRVRPRLRRPAALAGPRPASSTSA